MTQATRTGNHKSSRGAVKLARGHNMPEPVFVAGARGARWLKSQEVARAVQVGHDEVCALDEERGSSLGDGDDAHAGGSSGGDPGEGVFENDAVARIDPQTCSGLEKDVRRGLRPPDAVTRDDRAKMRAKPEAIEGCVYEARRGRRSDRLRKAAADSGVDQFQTAFLEGEPVEAIDECIRHGEPFSIDVQGDAEGAFDDTKRVVEAAARATARELGRPFSAKLTNEIRLELVPEGFGVDHQPVHIEQERSARNHGGGP